MIKISYKIKVNFLPINYINTETSADFKEH